MGLDVLAESRRQKTGSHSPLYSLLFPGGHGAVFIRCPDRQWRVAVFVLQALSGSGFRERSGAS